MEVYKAKGAAGLTAEKLKAAGIGWGDCFQEIPVSIQNSALVTALMAQVIGGLSDCLTDRDLEIMNEIPIHMSVQNSVFVTALMAQVIQGLSV